MFADASAIVAILLTEPEMAEFREKFRSNRRYTSPVAIYEATMAVARGHRKSTLEAHSVVMDLIKAYRVQILPIEARHTAIALEAFERFGKGRHRAGLNMGDCFAYACATVLKAPLLFKGDDFIHTDIRIG